MGDGNKVPAPQKPVGLGSVLKETNMDAAAMTRKIEELEHDKVIWMEGRIAELETENAALREWESRCAVALGVPGCHPEEMLHVIDSQREDAERYRWFRSKRLWDADQFPWPKDFEYPEPCLWDDGEMLDAAIDAVRKK